MLMALERGVKGGRWYSLFDKVATESALLSAFQSVKRNKGAAGVDHQTVEKYENDLTRELERTARQLRDGSYRPQAVRRVRIPKPGSKEGRPLGIPTVRDRVVQTALRHTLEPIFEKEFAEHSYGFRPGRGCKDALRRVDALLAAGHVHLVDADLKGYFDSIPHEPLLARVEEKVVDGAILGLIRAYLKAEVMEELGGHVPEEGSPQGAVISPLLANIYLDPLDKLIAAEGFEMVRYADDFVVMCRTPEEAGRALRLVQKWTEQAGLTLHATKTRVVDARQEPFEFLGYRFQGGRKYPRNKSIQKLRDTVRAKTRRSNGNSMRVICQMLNPILRGWFAYFKHARRVALADIDGYVRRRLRAILRKHLGKRSNHGRGAEQSRWPNAFFAKLGLFSMRQAHVLACQSARR
jgi:RNA-directed DNA polymerase